MPKQQIKNTAQHTNFALQPTTSTDRTNTLTLHWLHDHQFFRFYVFNTFIVLTTAERNKTAAAFHNVFGPARTTNISFNSITQETIKSVNPMKKIIPFQTRMAVSLPLPLRSAYCKPLTLRKYCWQSRAPSRLQFLLLEPGQPDLPQCNQHILHSLQGFSN